MSNITKKVIAKSFVELLEEKPFEKISIGDIAAKAGINRQTFYYHFKDIRDLIEWSLLTIADECIKDNNTFENWKEAYLSILLKIKESNKFYYALTLNDEYERYILNYLYKLTYDVVFRVVNAKKNEMKIRISDEDLDFITDFYKFPLVGFILDWIRSGLKDDPKAIVDRTSILLQGTLEKALNTLKI